MKSVPLLPLAFAALACTGNANGPLSHRSELRNDTLVVISTGTPPLNQVKAIRLFDIELVRPRAITSIENGVAIAEATQIHFVDTANGVWKTAGREGSGPGEYKSIAGLRGATGDTSVVFDASLQRLTFYDASGEVRRLAVVGAALPFVNARRDRPVSDRILYAGSNLYAVQRENLQLSRATTKVAVVRYDELGGARVLRAWADLGELLVVGQEIGSKVKRDAKAQVDLSANARVVFGRGEEYCFTVEDLEWKHEAARVMRVCRDAPRIKPRLNRARGNGEVTERLPTDRARLRLLQELPKYLPAFDMLQFDTEERVWVRTVGQVTGGHRSGGGLAGSMRQWEVFARDGRLVQSILLPSRFEAYEVRREGAWGTFEGEEGEPRLAWLQFSGLVETR